MRMLKMTNEEIWKPIKGYELLYEVSNFGRVKSLRKTNNQYSEHVTHGSSDGKHGYLKVKLKNETGNKTFQVHRLVAEAFIPNPNNLPQVNHKDENKKNNNVENLEWCDHLYNVNYGTRTKRSALHQGKPICQLKDGIIVNRFNSIMEAERETGINSRNIWRVLKGIRKHTAGCGWKYCEE